MPGERRISRMRFKRSIHNNRRVFATCGLVLMGLFYSDTQRFANRAVADPAPQILETAEASSIPSAHVGPILRLYQDDPLAYLKQARDDYDRRIRDYVCDFTKQELLGGRLSHEGLLASLQRGREREISLPNARLAYGLPGS